MTELYVFRGTAIGEVEEGALEGFLAATGRESFARLGIRQVALEGPSIGPRTLT
jgi:hypothetical protein